MIFENKRRKRYEMRKLMVRLGAFGNMRHSENKFRGFGEFSKWLTEQVIYFQVYKENPCLILLKATSLPELTSINFSPVLNIPPNPR